RQVPWRGRVEQQLDRARGCLVVQVRAGSATRAVEAVQLKRGRAEVSDRFGGGLGLGAGGGVKGDVVVDELAKKGEPRAHTGVVGIVGVRAERISWRRWIGGVHYPPRPAEFQQGPPPPPPRRPRVAGVAPGRAGTAGRDGPRWPLSPGRRLTRSRSQTSARYLS